MAASPLDPRTVLRARNGVAVVFAANGFLFANWIARLPAVRDALDMTPGRLGFVLLALSAGAVTALPLAGWVVHRLNPARAVLVSAGLAAGGLALAGWAPAVPVLVAALFVFGVGTGVWDVSMNVEAAEVERELGRPIMPRFHAGFSLGTVAGALVGAAAAGARLPIGIHLSVVAAGGLLLAVVCVRGFLSAGRQAAEAASAKAARAAGEERRGRGSSGAMAAWREPRTLAIGVFVLGMAFAEGAANDWLAIALVDGYGLDHAQAAIGFGVFVTAMTIARLVGPAVLQRMGRVPALRLGALLVLVGVVLVVAGGAIAGRGGTALALVVATLGALTWGAGAALGFPVGMSAASDDPTHAAPRVAVVSTIGYTAFIAGPPLIGIVADHVGVLPSLLAVSGAVAVSLLSVGSVRPVAGAPEVSADASAEEALDPVGPRPRH
jgi:fucose permease